MNTEKTVVKSELKNISYPLQNRSLSNLSTLRRVSFVIRVANEQDDKYFVIKSLTFLSAGG